MGGARAAMLYKERDNFFTAFQPFSPSIWSMGVVCWLLYSICLYFVSFLADKKKKREAEKEEFSLSESLWYFSIIPLHFGTDKQPSSLGGKILQGGWSFFALIFLATYTANLAAIFSQKSYTRPIESIDDIDGIDFKVNSSLCRVIGYLVVRYIAHRRTHRIIYTITPDENYVTSRKTAH